MIKNFLSLGKQPLANDFQLKSTNSSYILNLKYNNKNKLVSINKRIKKEIMFNKTYPYRSSLSISVENHFKNLSKIIKKNYSHKKILEIGTYTGYSTICLAEGLSKNGKIDTIDKNEELIKIQNKYFEESDSGIKLFNIPDML